MNAVQRIAKNAGVLLASKVVSYTKGLFFVMYTARYRGAAGFGVLSFALLRLQGYSAAAPAAEAAHIHQDGLGPRRRP